jgi:hypothetical protein
VVKPEGEEMSIKDLVSNIKHNGLLVSMTQLEKLYKIAIENEEKLTESEARCAALAAENAGLKASHPQPFGPVMMKALDAYEKHQDDVPETGMLDAFFILRDSILVDTTSTDAFLTEVRAQGACLVIDYHNDRADALRDIDRNGAFRHESAALDAIDVLMKIRKGVQS